MLYYGTLGFRVSGLELSRDATSGRRACRVGFRESARTTDVVLGLIRFRNLGPVGKRLLRICGVDQAQGAPGQGS